MNCLKMDIALIRPSRAARDEISIAQFKQPPIESRVNRDSSVSHNQEIWLYGARILAIEADADVPCLIAL
jgi:hypothetical protein